MNKCGVCRMGEASFMVDINAATDEEPLFYFVCAECAEHARQAAQRQLDEKTGHSGKC